MVIPFSNTKLRVPPGFQSLLVGLSTEILRSQPRSIHEFAADYFEKLLKRRAQGQSYLPDKQSSLEDRYYNNHSFQEEYRVNDPEINKAATRIQANFRGHQTRQTVEKMKQDSKQMIDADQQDMGYGREQTETPTNNLLSSHDYHRSSPSSSPYAAQKDKNGNNSQKPQNGDDVQHFDDEDPEIEREERNVADRVIREPFRGYREQKNSARESSGSRDGTEHITDQRLHQGFDNERTMTPPSTRFSEKMDSDRHDLGGNLTADDQIETGDNDDNGRPRLEREPTQLSDDFERHTQVPRDADLDQEVQPGFNDDEEDVNHSKFDNAATRIQASYRGYKTRKELGSVDSHDQHPSSISPNTQDELESARQKPEDREEIEAEDEDTAAAIKIQAAYRGYRVRKELEK